MTDDYGLPISPQFKVIEKRFDWYLLYDQIQLGDNPAGVPTKLEKFAELIVRECGYYADVFEAVGCPVDMDPTETKPSDYIKKQLGIENE